MLTRTTTLVAMVIPPRKRMELTFPAKVKRRAPPIRAGLPRSMRTARWLDLELLARESEVAANTGAEVPSQAGKVTDVQATVAEDDVAKITPLREHVPVDEGVFGLAGSGESTCRINDAR